MLQGHAKVLIALLVFVVVVATPVHAALSPSEIEALKVIREYIPVLKASWTDMALSYSDFCTPGKPPFFGIVYIVCGDQFVRGFDFNAPFTTNGTLGDVSGLTRFESLSFSNGNYDLDPWTLAFPQLKSFSFSESSFNHPILPTTISRWGELRTIVIEMDHGRYLPTFKHNTNLTSIRLRLGWLLADNFVFTLPADMFQNLSKVTDLYLHTSGHLRELPNIADMTSLRNLKIAANAFSALPDSFTGLTQLEEMDISLNPLLTKLPPSMKHCTSLRLLTAPNLPLIQADSWFDMTNTKIDSISLNGQNTMASLPDAFCQLSRQPYSANISIVITNSPLTSWPACFAQNAHVGSVTVRGCSGIDQFPSLLDLPAITKIDFSSCPIRAPFPSSTLTTTLTTLSIPNASIPGAFPNALIRDNAGLTTLNLANNRLTGPIASDTFGGHTLLKTINIGHNMLTGEFPSGLCLNGSGSILEDFDASKNLLTSLPSDLSDCVNVKTLLFSDNLLESLPDDSTFEAMTQLTTFGLGGNPFLQGELPVFWTTHPTLSFVNLSSCAFHGNIPPINSLSLTTVILSDNRLNGTLEDPIMAFKLVRLDFEKNRLRGHIGDSSLWMVAGQSLISLNMSRNELSGTLPSNLFSMLPRIGKIDFRFNGLSGGLPIMSSVKDAMEVLGDWNYFDLCLTNPQLNSASSNAVISFLHQLYDYGVCFCRSWYPWFVYVDGPPYWSCPAPGFVQPPVAIPDPRTPSLPPPPSDPVPPPPESPPTAPPFSFPPITYPPPLQTPTPSHPTGSTPTGNANEMGPSPIALAAAVFVATLLVLM